MRSLLLATVLGLLLASIVCAQTEDEVATFDNDDEQIEFAERSLNDVTDEDEDSEEISAGESEDDEKRSQEDSDVDKKLVRTCTSNTCTTRKYVRRFRTSYRSGLYYCRLYGPSVFVSVSCTGLNRSCYNYHNIYQSYVSSGRCRRSLMTRYVTYRCYRSGHRTTYRRHRVTLSRCLCG